MESQNKASLPVMDGLERRVASRSEGARTCDLLLRVLALVLTLAAAIVLGVDKQTKVVPIKILDTLPPISIPVSAKWNYLPAFTWVLSSKLIMKYIYISSSCVFNYHDLDLLSIFSNMKEKKSSSCRILGPGMLRCHIKSKKIT